MKLFMRMVVATRGNSYSIVFFKATYYKQKLFLVSGSCCFVLIFGTDKSSNFSLVYGINHRLFPLKF